MPSGYLLKSSFLCKKNQGDIPYEEGVMTIFVQLRSLCALQAPPQVADLYRIFCSSGLVSGEAT